MQRLCFLAGCLLVLSVTGCRLSGNNSNGSNALESCFDVGNGTLQCVHTPNGLNKAAADVNHDGRVDTFVCGNGKPGAGGHGDKDKDPAATGEKDDDSKAGDGGHVVAGDDSHGDKNSAEKDDEGDDDGDGVGDHEDCDKKGCVVIATGGPGDKDKDGLPDDDHHAAGGAGGSGEKDDDHAAGGASGSGDKDTEKEDDGKEGSRSHVMMCADGGAPPPPTTPPPVTPPPVGQPIP
jgi:hypothetical protein